jgi:hypothetical protein
VPSGSNVGIADTLFFVDLLNIATALFVAVLGFGFTMRLVEYANPVFKARIPSLCADTAPCVIHHFSAQRLANKLPAIS